jgi:hypothetical protein
VAIGGTLKMGTKPALGFRGKSPTLGTTLKVCRKLLKRQKKQPLPPGSTSIVVSADTPLPLPTPLWLPDLLLRLCAATRQRSAS